MTFGQPQYLWALLVVPALMGFFLFVQKVRIRKLKNFASSHLWPAVVPEVDFSKRRYRAGLFLAAVAFMVLALARPQWGYRDKEVPVSGLDIMLLLDLSNSMEVEDVVPNRLKKAKHFIRKLLEGLQGDRVGLVVFAGSAYPASPLTTDMAYVAELVDGVTTKTIQNQGTDLGLAIQVAAASFKRGAEGESQDLSETKNEELTRATILITDGEDLEEKAAESVKELSKVGSRLYVIGVGTQRGGRIPTRDKNGVLRGYLKSPSGEEVLSRFDSKTLVQLADAGQGKYWTLTTSESEVNEVLMEIGKLERTEGETRKFRIYEERYQIPLFIALILLLIELFVPLRRLKSVASVGVIFWLFSLNAQAGDASLGVVLDNQKGVEAFENGDIDEAREHFGAAQAKDPTRPELFFNQGVVQGEQKDSESSIFSFEAAGQQAIQDNNLNLGARAFYNQGVVFEREKQFDPAARSYLRSLELAKKTEDRELQKKIQEALQRLAVKKQQQQGSGDGEGNSKNEDDQKNKSKDDKDKGQEGQQKDKNKNPNQNENKKYKKQTSANEKFKSEKLSPQDAKQLMRDLMEREKRTRERLDRKKGSRGDGGRNW